MDGGRLGVEGERSAGGRKAGREGDGEKERKKGREGGREEEGRQPVSLIKGI